MMFTNSNSPVTRAALGGFGTMIFAGLCLAAATVPARAAAMDGLSVRSETVRTADLNLAASAGRKALDVRIAAAATRVCGTPASDLANRARHARCVADAIASARTRINPTLAFAS